MTNTVDSVVDELEVKLLEAARDYQQNFYEIVSDWNIYQKDEHKYLEDFIGYGLYGPPQYNPSESEHDDKSVDDFKHFAYENDKKKVIRLVFEKVIEYGSNGKSDGVVLCGIIYNVIFNKIETQKSLNKIKDAIATRENEKKKEKCDEKENGDKDEKGDNADGIEATDFDTQLQVYPVPVFKVRLYRSEQATERNNDGKKDAAENEETIYYIDNSGRVYSGFADYMTTNTLPVCTMVLPKDGRYQGDPGFSSKSCTPSEDKKNLVTKVWTEVQESPAGNTAAKLLMGGDIVTTVVTVAAMGVGIAAMMTPIGAGIALASAVGAGVSGAWSVGRCAQQLADRGKHGESINVTDRNALGAWIGIAGGTMGLAATGGTVLLARAVRTGSTIGRAATIAYDAVQIGNIIVNGVGIGYKSYDIYANHKNGEFVTVQDVFFLTAHVFFFCNSVMNVQTARNMIETTQVKLLKDYEDTLRSNRHRKEFQRIARNTRATGTSDVASNEEIIRAINKIDNKDDFFQAMVRNRKAFSASSARATFSSNGKVVVNGVMTIDPIEFASLPKDVRIDIVKGVSDVRTTFSTNVKTSIVNVANDQMSYKNFSSRNNDVLKEFCLKHSCAMLQTAPVAIKDFANVLHDLRDVQNQAEIFLKLLNMGYVILRALPRDREVKLGDTLAQIVQFLWDYLKTNMRNYRPEFTIVDPWAQTFLIESTRNLWIRIEREIEIWVEAFSRWIQTQLTQSIHLNFA